MVKSKHKHPAGQRPGTLTALLNALPPHWSVRDTFDPYDGWSVRVYDQNTVLTFTVTHREHKTARAYALAAMKGRVV